MRRLTLTEYGKSDPVRLRPDERDAIASIEAQILIQPAPGLPGHFTITPSSYVGLIRLPDLVLEIQPKIAIDRLLFLVSYAIRPKQWHKIVEQFAAAPTVVEAMVPIFCRLVAAATYRGLLHGYRTTEESQSVVRGRILFQQQAQRRAGIALPLDVRFDDSTDDIVENRILRAALQQLARLPLRSVHSMRSLREIMAAFRAVTPVEFDGRAIPGIHFTRLNEHYRDALSCAEVIIRSMSLRLSAGSSSGTCFLLDMNEVFEAFIHRALLEALGASESAFPRGRAGLHLDSKGHVALRPDLSWWRGTRCMFVGDAKYKRLAPSGFMHADLYQLLAYTTASCLPSGLLIYAAGERSPGCHTVPYADKQLIVETIDLAGTPAHILIEVSRIASIVRNMARDALGDSVKVEHIGVHS